ncbi:hypothetical protein ACFRCI_17380 [Streptomyces sp. NPDC056638]|uniref:hypothetical protein n=1 Tax=Streptomyces sp. NPDC056638 TaxID=3345887 RepID=UPI0036757BB6
MSYPRVPVELHEPTLKEAQESYKRLRKALSAHGVHFQSLHVDEEGIRLTLSLGRINIPTADKLSAILEER